MIDRDGNVRIMDFGIARSLKVKGMTGAGVVIGTPEYMSPEQIEGQDVDSRSDIYSLGIILYEMVTGRVPFEGDTFLSIAVKQKTEQPRNPRELNPQIPDDIVRLILHCLEKDKAKRYQNVEDILSELGKIEKGIPDDGKDPARHQAFDFARDHGQVQAPEACHPGGGARRSCHRGHLCASPLDP